MSEHTPPVAPVVVVTGANGLVGAEVCRALLERGAEVRALVRRAGTAPAGTHEVVGDFTDAATAARVLAGSDAAVTTVHPMGSDRATQERIGVAGTATFARAAATARTGLLVHVSTAAVYDRSPEAGDVDEAAALVGADAHDYSATKRDADAALATIDGLTRVLVRPPAILGAGATSVWNTLRPAGMRDHEEERQANPTQSFAWVHVSDLAAVIADLATGRIPSGDDPATGPVAERCTALNVAAGTAALGDYIGTVTTALGVAPVWDERPAWKGRVVADRAQAWGWAPTIDLETALAEIAAGLRA